MNQPFQKQDMAMLRADKASAVRDIVTRWKAQGYKVGFVPTMGALHAGHLSLVEKALAESDRVVASIFVNPAQFAPHEDFESYPRAEASDLQKLQAAGAHLVYTPGEKEIYPPHPPSADGSDALSRGEREGPAQREDEEILPAESGLENDFRPHFFGGVKKVVRILFDQVQPDVALFGEKDFQQLQVIREMVEAYKMPVEIVGAPIVRDEEGLALSSRNAYLSPEDLEIARTLNRVLRETASSIVIPSEAEGSDPLSSDKDPSTSLRSGRDDVLEKAEKQLLANGFDKVDYVAQRWGRVLGAAWIGKTRLIDNVEIKKAAE